LVVARPLPDNHTARSGLEAIPRYGLDKAGIGYLAAVGSPGLEEIRLDKDAVASFDRLLIDVVKCPQERFIIVVFYFYYRNFTHYVAFSSGLSPGR
jgi:hypothetical protein